MSEYHLRSCQCGAIYRRTEATAPGRQSASFECSLCDTTLETWNTAWVPTYQFIAGPVIMPEPMQTDEIHAAEEYAHDQREIAKKLRRKLN